MKDEHHGSAGTTKKTITGEVMVQGLGEKWERLHSTFVVYTISHIGAIALQKGGTTNSSTRYGAAPWWMMIDGYTRHRDAE